MDKYNFKAIVIQSGEDEFYDEEILIKLVKEMKRLGILIFLSIGSRNKKLYKKLYEAGARAALLRFETSNKKIFKKLRPKTKLEKRIDLIKYLKKIGYVLATGFIVGLPDETKQDIINNILLTKSLDPDMFSFGPLIPTKNTPLENQKIINKELMLKIIAITRLLVVNTKILTILAGVLVISVVVLLIVRRRLIKYYMKLIEMDPPDVNISPFGLIALIIGISVLIMLLLL